ncbi:MAG: transcription termination/antitermination protein NusA [Bacteroidaceae bacterium]|nr:transcription termination/antitermination protein NusA [Bacteroidaceae bacterium]
MAKKQNNLLIETFAEFKETKNIDRATLVSVLEDSFRNVIAKTVGSDENYDVIVNPDKGDLEIYRNRTVVENGAVKDPNLEISLDEARQIAEDYEVGEDVSEPVDFSKFGRRAILTLRQTLASKILELEHDALYNKYVEKVGEIISAEVYQVWHKEVLLLDEDGNELLLPKAEQIPGDFFRKGEPARAVVARVDNSTGNPKIILSRTSPEFLKRLLENEVPEIAEGVIVVRKIARVPGERAKIAVESFDDRIDPVGACVGVRGSRVQGIVRELRGENLDVIPWTNNLQLLISRALGPAQVNSVHLDEEKKHCEVYLDPDQVSLAIGKGGLNIRLASMISETEIDVFRELPEGEEEELVDDLNLDDFKDEIDDWVIEELKNNGWTTARAVLEAPREMLIHKADLEEETVDEVLRILRQEFADDEEAEKPANEEATEN